MNQETIQPLLNQIADYLTMIDPRRTYTAQPKPAPDAREDTGKGKGYLIANDGFIFYIANDAWIEFNRSRDRLHCTPENPKRADGRYHTADSDDRPTATVTARRPANAIAADLYRRVIAPGIIWQEKARTNAAIIDNKEALKSRDRQFLAKQFNGRIPSHSEQYVYGDKWKARASYGGGVDELIITDIDLETAADILALLVK